MAHQTAARRQRREHRGLHARDAGKQLHRARAQGARGRQLVAIPLDVEARPAGAEERIEADVVVGRGRLDVAGIVEPQGLSADLLPVRLQQVQFGELARTQIRPRPNPGAHVHRRIQGREQDREVGQRAQPAEPHPAAQIHIGRRGDKNNQKPVTQGKHAIRDPRGSKRSPYLPEAGCSLGAQGFCRPRAMATGAGCRRRSAHRVSPRRCSA